MEEQIKKLTYIVIVGFAITILLLIGLYFKEESSTTSNNDTSTTTNNTNTYDVSKMNKVSVAEAKALFDKKGLQVLYIGRENCSACVKTVPVLNKVQEELKYTTNYLDLQTISNWKSDLKELSELFTAKTTVTTTINGELKTLNDTIGNIFLEYGFTPTIVIIKDGKAVDGFIGYEEHDTMKKIIEKYI